MNYLGYICRELHENPALTQRQMAGRLGISLGKCNTLAQQAVQQGYIQAEAHCHRLTPKGLEYLEQYRVRNAIISAERIDLRFIPGAQHLPKALLPVDGEPLVERLIRQLQQCGVRDITVLVGYLAEKLEYLADSFGVSLLYVPTFNQKSNLAALHMVREKLGNTYLIQGEFWMENSLFHEFEPESWFCCHRHDGASDGICLTVDGKRRIRDLARGGVDTLVKRGPLYFGDAFVQRFLPMLEQAYRQPGMAALTWEHMLAGRTEKLPLYANIQPPGLVRDFASPEELNAFGKEKSGDNAILRDISGVLDVPHEAIQEVRWLKGILAHHVFAFRVEDTEYAYRIAANRETTRFTTAKQEILVYKVLQPLGICDRLVHLDPETGVKITHIYQQADELQNAGAEELAEPLGVLKRVHQSRARVRHRFSMEGTLRKYHGLCRRAGCVRFADYANVHGAMGRPLAIIAKSSQPLVLCHLNAHVWDYVRDTEGRLRLACWGFGGMCHAEADIAMLALQFNLKPPELDTLLHQYYGSEAAAHRALCVSYAATGGLLWSLYGEYFQHSGGDFSAFAMKMYHLCKLYLREVGRL